MVAAMLLSTTLLLVIGATAYLTLHTLIEREVSAKLNSEAQLVSQRLQGQLDREIRAVSELSNNSLTASGLKNAQERQQYLRPFLTEYQRAHPEIVEIGLYDWTGEALASSGGKFFFRQGLVAEVTFKQQQQIWLLSTASGARLLIAAPVRATQSSTVEGALICEINLKSLASQTFASKNTDIALNLADASGKPLYQTHQPLTDADQFKVTIALDTVGSLKNLGISVTSSISKQKALSPLRKLQWVFLALALLSFLLTYVAARALAKRITQPLTQLSAHAQRITSEGLNGLREVGNYGEDELGRMAMAFNAMVRSLQQVYAELEQRVSSRTRELEHRELYLRAILDNFPFIIWLKDAEGRFLAVNQMMSNACGQASPQAMTGLTDMDVWPADLAARYQADDREVMTSGVAKMTEKTEEEQGNKKWFETYKKPVIDRTGKLLGSVGFARNITERKQAEVALLLQKRAIMAAADGIVIADMTHPDKPIIFVNPAFEAITGYTFAEVKGTKAEEIFKHETNHQPAKRALGKVMDAGLEHREVLRNYRKDGTTFWNELTLAPVHDENNIVTHYIGIQHDITQLIESMNALGDSEQRNSLTIGALRDGLWDWNIQTNALYLSPSWAEILGYQPEELTGQLEFFLRCLPEDETNSVMAQVQAHLNGETEIFISEHRMIRKDGREIWVSDRGSVVAWDEAGRPLRMVGTIKDISEHQKSVQTMFTWMGRLDSILTLSRDAYIYFDTDSHVASVNLGFEQITGLLAGDVEGLHVIDFMAQLQSLSDPTQPFPDLTHIFHSKHTATENTCNERVDLTSEIHLLNPVKRVLGFDLRVNDTGDSSVLYLRDITRETEVDRMKSEFLSTAAHELRTPMASIMGFSELLLMHDFSPAAAKDMLETIHRQSVRLTGLLNELLDLARIEARSGKVFEFSLQTLAPVIYDSIAAMTLRADQDIVNVDISEQMPKLNIDPEKIQQAMLNILSNALKYSPNGGEVDVRAFERTRAHGTQACISVRDHGIGMKPEQLARVFERFFRADPSGNIPGTGLGMSLVKEIMEIHGGGVEVESTFGVGTTVTLWLPVAEQEISAPDQA